MDLISAGIPANVRLSARSSDARDAAITKLDEFCRTNFMNSLYAVRARSLTGENNTNAWDGDLTGWSSTSNLIAINVEYWLANRGEDDDENRRYRMRYVTREGLLTNAFVYDCGVRPVVELKAGIQTNETKDKNFLGQTCWELR